MQKLGISLCLYATLVTAAVAETRIVTWNAQAELGESIQERILDFGAFAQTVQPDVVVLIEMNGEAGVEAFADQLGWDNHYSITSNLGKLSGSVFSALEMAVISKMPIIRAIEHDANVDGTHSVRRNGRALGAPIEEKKLSSHQIKGFGSPLHHTDRGTVRVDLLNGLSIFPVHLKSNRLSKCDLAEDALEMIEESGFELSATLKQQLSEAYAKGSASVTIERKKNALKRERVMAAVARQASRAMIRENRVPVILGDFNTAYEAGKVGFSIEDCELQAFSCNKQPFPASACTDGDGFDDTLGLLETGLVENTKWTVLSKELGRTYVDTVFSDAAIDHIAVPLAVADKFSRAEIVGQPFGSDHFPVVTVFND